MFRNINSPQRVAITIVSTIIITGVCFQPVFSQARVGSVITAGTSNRVSFEPSSIPGADLYEACYFDSSDTDINGCVAMNSAGRDMLTADLEDLVGGRVYGFFIRAHYYNENGKTTYSDTVFSTWETSPHNIEVTSHAPLSLKADNNAAGAQTGIRAHNYPNPFNPKKEDTRIVFNPDRSGNITMLIYDLFGHLVLEQPNVEVGDLSWDGRNGRRELVASGGYICVLKMGGEVVSKHKIAVIK